MTKDKLINILTIVLIISMFALGWIAGAH